MNKLFFVTMGVLSCGALARADAPVVSPLTVPEAAADASALWAGITGGKLTAAQAWQDGLLDADTVQTGLAQGVASGQSENAMQLRVELGALLAKNAPAVAALGATLPAGVQLALADYYASIGDERAAPLYEAVIAQTQPSYEQGLRLLALGKFWSQIGQPQKSEEVFGRGRAVLLAQGKNPHLAAEMLLMTARAWGQAGDADNTQRFYSQVAHEGDEWFKALAIYDRAYALVTQGQHAQARALLQQPATTQGAEPIRVALLSLLGYSYYLTGETDNARDFSGQALTLYQSLPAQWDDKGLQGVVRRSAQIVRLTEAKPIAPLIFEPGELRLVVVADTPLPGAERPEKRRLVVRARTPVAFAIASDLPAMTAIIGDGWKPVSGSDWLEKEVEIQVKLSLLPAKSGTMQGTLKVTSAQVPDFGGQVPVKIELR